MIENHKTILKELLTNFNDAKSAKEPINKKIAEWIDLYNGKPYGNESKARSQIVVRDVYKTIESIKPNLTEPFVGSNRVIDSLPYTAAGEESSEASEKMLNWQFSTQQDRRQFMDILADVLTKEGTVWVKNEWKYDDEEFRTPMTVPKQMLPMITEEYEVVADNGDSVDIEIVEVNILVNESNLRICRNEHIFPDPTAEQDEDIQFVIHQYDTTMNDLKASGVYKNLDDLEMKRADHRDNTSLGSLRDAEATDFGRRTGTFKYSDKARNKITIVEYWGLYDINDDGEAVPIIATWDRENEVCIRMEENPMPDKAIPFERATYIAEPFSLWGKALADPMADGQKIHTAFMRGFIDNASLANNGQKFIQKGGIDQQNFRRMVNGEKHIYMNQNPAEVMQDGSYNEMPSSVFNVYEMVESQNEGITGISRINQGLDAGAMSQTATGVSTLTSMSQRRLLDTVRNVANLLRKLFRRQLAYSLHFLEEEDWHRITGMQKPQGELGKDFDIKIDLITDAQKQSKIGQFNLMMQNLQYVGDGVKFEMGNHILSKYFELFDEPYLADMIKNQEPPQPDPMQQQMQQLEMQKLQAEIAERQSRAQENQVDMDLKSAKADNERAKSRQTHSNADTTDLDFLRKQSGQDKLDDMAIQDNKDMNQGLLNKQKDNS